MEEVMKSAQHKRDAQGNVVVDYIEEVEFSYIDCHSSVRTLKKHVILPHATARYN